VALDVIVEVIVEVLVLVEVELVVDVVVLVLVVLVVLVDVDVVVDVVVVVVVVQISICASNISPTASFTIFTPFLKVSIGSSFAPKVTARKQRVSVRACKSRSHQRQN